MLQPKRYKYRKQHRGRMKGKAYRGNFVAYGQFGLQALEPCWLTGNQIEAARVAINRYLRRDGKVWIKVFPDKSVTKKPAEVRMGSGKGNVEEWVAVVRPGRVLFELAGVNRETAREAFRLASHKLPIKTKMIENLNYVEDPHLKELIEAEAEAEEEAEKEAAEAAEAANNEPEAAHAGAGKTNEGDAE